MWNGAPFAMFLSNQVSINDVHFEGYNISEFCSGIFTFDSTIDFGSYMTFANPANVTQHRFLG
jgi:hypothetical protein